jgi:hypothetical protein
MKNDITIKLDHHNFTSQNKLDWFGYGEWVEEPDEVEFTYKLYECCVTRCILPEPSTMDVNIFGGHLCGYVRIPNDHPYLHKRYQQMDISCHYGLTFGECSVGHWIGFDCAHSSDYVPSLQKFWWKMKEDVHPLVWNALKNSDSHKTYKNISFCVQQCIEIVNQLIIIAERVKDDEN